MDFRTWYDALSKPAWTPPPGTISLIWTILNPIILISFGFVIYKAFRGRLPWLVALALSLMGVESLLARRKGQKLKAKS